MHQRPSATNASLTGQHGNNGDKLFYGLVGIGIFYDSKNNSNLISIYHDSFLSPLAVFPARATLFRSADFLRHFVFSLTALTETAECSRASPDRNHRHYGRVAHFITIQIQILFIDVCFFFTALMFFRLASHFYPVYKKKKLISKAQAKMFTVKVHRTVRFMNEIRKIYSLHTTLSRQK